MLRSENVAPPPTALSVVVPLSVASGAPVNGVMLTLTASVKAVAVLPYASTAVTTTAGEITSPALVSVGWPVNTRSTAAPGVAVAVNVTGLPANVPEVAVNVFVPTLAPRVQDVAVATPPSSVVTGTVGSTVPPPAVTANVTATPATGLPNSSVTAAAGAVATAVPTVAV